MELTEREKEIIYNALGKLYDSRVDGVYKYHSMTEILELHRKFYKEIKKDNKQYDSTLKE